MAKGISLHVGLNAVDPDHYSGWDGQLNACEFDAKDMSLIASLNGFSTQILLTNQATRQNVINAISEAAAALQGGDIFTITYSGHGGQIPDNNSDEDDSQDETWCLFDGEILDDELYNLWNQFREGVRVLVVSDSCHSGTVTKFIRGLRKASDADEYKSRFLPPEIAASTYFAHKTFYDNIQKEVNLVALADIRSTVKLLSACMDNQESKDGTFNGRYTGILKAVWNGGKFGGDYLTFYKQILNRFTPFPDQSPNHLNIGKIDGAFDKQQPFTI